MPSLTARLKAGAEVLLKPNIINAKPAEKCVCTHPTVVRAVAEVALEAGCRVTVADEPGYAMTSDAARSLEPMPSCCTDAVPPRNIAE